MVTLLGIFVYGTFSETDPMTSDSPYKALRAHHKVFNLRHPAVRELLYSLRYGLPRGSDGTRYSYPLSQLAKLSGYSPSYLSSWLRQSAKPVG